MTYRAEAKTNLTMLSFDFTHLINTNSYLLVLSISSGERSDSCSLFCEVLSRCRWRKMKAMRARKLLKETENARTCLGCQQQSSFAQCLKAKLTFMK